jgi:hypothetical protein
VQQVLKIAVDHFPDIRLIATGSSTPAAKAKFADTLTGRKMTLWLTPMTSCDVAEFGSRSLEERLWYGGLPPFYLAGDTATPEEYREWLDSFWARDVQELFRLERRHSFVRFVELLLVNSGGIFEGSAYAGPCEVSRTTAIVGAPKVYAFDTGLVRHARVPGVRPHHLRTKHQQEVDFAATSVNYELEKLKAHADVRPTDIPPFIHENSQNVCVS